MMQKNVRFAVETFPTNFFILKIFMDVDCSTITYETPPSSTVLSAVEKAKAELASIASNLTQETLERWVLIKYAYSTEKLIWTRLDSPNLGFQDSDEGGKPGKLFAEAHRPEKQHCQ